jgi:hypothetical protein
MWQHALRRELREHATHGGKALSLPGVTLGNEGAAAIVTALDLGDEVFTAINVSSGGLDGPAAGEIARACRRREGFLQFHCAENDFSRGGAAVLESIFGGNSSSSADDENDDNDTKNDTNNDNDRSTDARPLLSHFTDVSLAWCKLGDDSVVFLAADLFASEPAALRALTRLDLANCDLTATALAPLSKLLLSPDCHLAALSLSGNRFGGTVKGEGADGADVPVVQLLADGLGESPSLPELFLCKAEIDDAGACALAEAMRRNKRLERLHLEGNPILDRGTDAIIESLKENCTLQHVGLSLEFSSERRVRLIRAMDDEGRRRATEVQTSRTLVAAMMFAWEECGGEVDMEKWRETQRGFQKRQSGRGPRVVHPSLHAAFALQPRFGHLPIDVVRVIAADLLVKPSAQGLS